MGVNSKIEWTDHTFNLVWGCTKVSPACQFCYAESLAKRYGYGWGPDAERRILSADYWKQPLKWNKAAKDAGIRARVFCSSMADVFEDHETVESQRLKLWTLIDQTPNLDWLLLTKRPENMTRMAPDSWRSCWPENVVAMTTVENQEWADKRLPALLKVPAQRRGVSYEPALGPVNFGCITVPLRGSSVETFSALHSTDGLNKGRGIRDARLDWVIAGGESGPGARPAHPDWFRSVRDQCQSAGVSFFFKQWGNWAPDYRVDDPDLHVWPDNTAMRNVGKKRAGRQLDNREWNEFSDQVEARDGK